MPLFIIYHVVSKDADAKRSVEEEVPHYRLMRYHKTKIAPSSESK